MPCFRVLRLLSDWMCEQRRWCCHGGGRADADQTSDPRDVFHHHDWGGLRVRGAACHTSSRGGWNQPPHQLLSVQRSSSHESVHTLLNIGCKYVAQLVCTWLKRFRANAVTHFSFSQSSHPQFCHSAEICCYRIKTATFDDRSLPKHNHSALTQRCLWVAAHANRFSS